MEYLKLETAFEVAHEYIKSNLNLKDYQLSCVPTGSFKWCDGEILDAYDYRHDELRFQSKAQKMLIERGVIKKGVYYHDYEIQRLIDREYDKDLNSKNWIDAYSQNVAIEINGSVYGFISIIDDRKQNILAINYRQF